MKQMMTPIPANEQNQDNAGSTVTEPTKKAKASVAEVIKMEIPPCLAVAMILSSILRLGCAVNQNSKKRRSEQIK